MAPIFTTTNVPFEVIGEHMRRYAKDNGLSQKPRTLLVGGLRAEKILVASPLLKWYLEHGLQCSQIYTTIEFGRQQCFKKFTEEVTKARREGALSDGSPIKADTMKLIG